MIVYFTDREANVIGHASTSLPRGYQITEDTLTQELETGTTTLEITLPYTPETYPALHTLTALGHYILVHREDRDFIGTITEREDEEGEFRVYAEDAGIDLINSDVLLYPDSELGDDQNAHPIEYYVNRAILNTGFVIGTNQITGSMVYQGDAMTALERLQDLAKLFDAEIEFEYDVKGLSITSKKINLLKAGGIDDGIVLSVGSEIRDIRAKESMAEVVTGLQAVGNEVDGTPLTLHGMTYDDGDYYIGPRPDYSEASSVYNCLYSRNSRKQWARYAGGGTSGKVKGDGDIIKIFSVDTVDQSVLFRETLAELKRRVDASMSYECEIETLPLTVFCGSIVTIRDAGRHRIYKARLAKISRSECDGTLEAEFTDIKEV